MRLYDLVPFRHIGQKKYGFWWWVWDIIGIILIIILCVILALVATGTAGIILFIIFSISIFFFGVGIPESNFDEFESPLTADDETDPTEMGPIKVDPTPPPTIAPRHFTPGKTLFHTLVSREYSEEELKRQFPQYL